MCKHGRFPYMKSPVQTQGSSIHKGKLFSTQPLAKCIIIPLFLLTGFRAFAIGGPGSFFDTALDSFAHHFAIFITALMAVAILWIELYLRRKIYKDEVQTSKVRLRAEEESRKSREAWFRDKTSEIRSFGKPLAEEIAHQLRRDHDWAVDVLERAGFASRVESVFGERSDHYRKEKELIAHELTPFLLKHVKNVVEGGKEVTLLIDSGTTLYTFFKELGEAFYKCHSEREKWLEKVKVVTNSLAGIEALIGSSRKDRHNRYSDLAIRCKLLPGDPLPIYSAVTGDETVKAIEHLQQGVNGDMHFIALLTGNWIRIGKDGIPRPLARGEGHLEVKEAYAKISQDIFVISPLGKTFIKSSLEEVNQALGFTEDNLNQEKKPYKEVDLSPYAERVMFISTDRDPDRVLHPLSLELHGKLNYVRNPERVDEIILKHCNCCFRFSDLPNSWAEELLIEFPHKHTTRGSFPTDHFLVSVAPPASRITGPSPIRF